MGNGHWENRGFWSGKRDSNPRLQPWQGCTLPLSYSRSVSFDFIAESLRYRQQFFPVASRKFRFCPHLSTTCFRVGKLYTFTKSFWHLLSNITISTCLHTAL